MPPPLASHTRTHLNCLQACLREAQPSLVLLPGGCPEDVAAGELEQRCAQRALERAGLLYPRSGTTVLHHACGTLSEALEFMAVLGAAAGCPEAARLLVEQLRARLRRVAAAVRRPAAALDGVSGGSLGGSSQGSGSGGISSLYGSCASLASSSGGGASSASVAAAGAAAHSGACPRVLMLDGAQPLAAAGRWTAEAVQLAGGCPVGAPPPGAPSRTLDWEQVRALAPDVLILLLRGRSAEEAALQTAQLAALPGWWALPAVRCGAVFVFDDGLLGRPGPRLVEGVEALAHALHPHAWPQSPPEGGVLKLMLHDGQRCRPRLLPNYFSRAA